MCEATWLDQKSRAQTLWKQYGLFPGTHQRALDRGFRGEQAKTQQGWVASDLDVTQQSTPGLGDPCWPMVVC